MGAPWSGDLLMSKAVFSDPFVFRGVRRNRLSFLQTIAFQIPCWAVLGMGSYRLLEGGGSPIGEAGGLAGLPMLDMLVLAAIGPLSVPLLLFYLAAGAQRCRDCGVSGLAALALLIPPLNVPMLIALCLCRGQDGANKFGENPLRRLEVASRFDAMLEMKAADK